MRALVLATILFGGAACAPRGKPAAPGGREILPEAAVWGEWRGVLRESEPGTIAGQVAGANDGAAIPGARIWVLDAAGGVLAQAASDAQGAFRVEAPSRARIVAASAPGWGFFVEEIEAVWTATPRIVMDPAVTISGIVLRPDGTPLEGAEVWAIDLQRAAHWPAAVSRIVRTGPGGRFTIRDAPDGLVGAVARYPGLDEGRSLIQQAAGGRVLTGADVGLERRVTLRGRAIANAEVGYLPAREVRNAQPRANAVARADDKGRFELRVSPVAGWVVATTSTLDGATFVQLEEGETAASASIEMRSYPRITGRVLDPSGAPLPGATVERMHDWSAPDDEEARALRAFRSARQRGLAGARTDSSGRFDFPMFDAASDDGHITLWVERADGEDATSVSFQEGASPDIQLEVRRSLAGTVRDADGHSLRENGRVEATRVTPESRLMRSARIEGGAFELDGLESGMWSLVAEIEGREKGPPASVAIGEERPTPITLVAGAASQASRVLRGRVHTPDGKPLAGVRVSPGRRLRWADAVRTGADGSFEITVREGESSLFFYMPEHASTLLPVPEGELDVTMTPGIAAPE